MDSIKSLCVLGLGYVGLPTAAVFAVNGLQVLGVDPNTAVVTAVNAGDAQVEEAGLKTLVQASVSSGNLRACTDPEPADAFIIAVPTPLRPDRSADLSHVETAARSICPHLRPGNLVILESTCPPGTTDGLLCEVLAESGLTPGRDLHVAYCPERVLPGRIVSELVQNDRLVGGLDEPSARLAAELYRRVVDGQVHVTTARTAELAKLFENAYRDVNIAFANELARISRRWDVDPRDVIALANHHPRVNILTPGPGVGGHCVPIDPWFLVQEHAASGNLIRAARAINDSQPEWIVERVLPLLPANAKVAVWGVAYKGNVDDARETPALRVIEQLQANGVAVRVSDPRVKRFPHPLVDLAASVIDADCLLVLTDHPEFAAADPAALAPKMRQRLVFDTRACLPHPRWLSAGFRVITL